MTYVFRTGDPITITWENVVYQYIVRELVDDLVYISPVSNMDIRNIIVYINDRWRVKDRENVDYIIEPAKIPIAVDYGEFSDNLPEINARYSNIAKRFQDFANEAGLGVATDRHFDGESFIQYAIDNYLTEKSIDDIYAHQIMRKMEEADLLLQEDPPPREGPPFSRSGEQVLQQETYPLSKSGRQCTSACKRDSRDNCYCSTEKYSGWTGTFDWDYCNNQECASLGKQELSPPQGNPTSNPSTTEKEEKDLYEWPAISVEVVQPGAETSDFLRYAREREARIMRATERYAGKPIVSSSERKDYPGDDFFEDIPEELVRYIATNDAPIEGQELMPYHLLLREIWVRYGPILKYVDFFSKNVSEGYICVMSKNVPKLLGILPDWVQELYKESMDRYLESDELRCGPGALACMETVRMNRGFEQIQPIDEPPEIDPLQLAREIRQGLHRDRAAIVIEFDLGDFGDHIMSILRLRDPTRSPPLTEVPTKQEIVYRDFTCQSYIYQSVLTMEEVEDVPTYLERIARLRTETDQNKFLLEYERLFHAKLSRIPTSDEWLEGPTARVINGH